VWRIFDLVAPDLKLTPYTNSYADDYPFSVRVQDDKKVSVQDIMRFNRDHDEDTPFDTNKGA
jgi:dipeptidase